MLMNKQALTLLHTHYIYTVYIVWESDVYRSHYIWPYAVNARNVPTPYSYDPIPRCHATGRGIGAVAFKHWQHGIG